MVAVKSSPEAKSDVKQIISYYKQIAPTYAIELADSLFSSTDALEQFPQMGQEELLLSNKRYTYRYLLVKRRYKVEYLYNEEKQKCDIVLVWDCRRNPELLTNNEQLI